MFGNSPVEGIKKTLSEEFRFHSSSYHENLFSSFELDNRTLSFIKYYNRTVLDWFSPLLFGQSTFRFQ